MGEKKGRREYSGENLNIPKDHGAWRETMSMRSQRGAVDSPD